MRTVKRLRLEKGWSQKDLADKSGVGQDTISGIESGKHEPRPSTLRKLARALDAEVVDFFQDEARVHPDEQRPKAAAMSLEWAMDQTVSAEEFNAAIAQAPDEAREDLRRQLLEQGQRLPNDRKWTTGNPPKVRPPIVRERLKALDPPPIARMSMSDEGNVCRWFIPRDQWDEHRADVDKFFDGESYEDVDARVYEEALLYA